jgi:hypothetical protein
MKKKEKKEYEKPEVTKIKLDAKTAVLATCKNSGGAGGGRPGGVFHCLTVPACRDEGS